MRVKMTLVSDAIFGNGISVPGEEDISLQLDKYGFPYYRGSTFKGVFREELMQYLEFSGKEENETKNEVTRLLGTAGSDDTDAKLVFSDFLLSAHVRNVVLNEIGLDRTTDVRDAVTNVRAFTAIDENGMIKEGSLRMARCVNKGLVFYASISGVDTEDEITVKNILGMIKWIGTMRNRGFGKVRIEEA